MHCNVCSMEWVLHTHTLIVPCSMMRGRIKGTDDSTINAVLATAVLYELLWEIWNCVGKFHFVVMTAYTRVY